MRTNVVLDDRLVRQAMRISGKKTKRDVIDEALRRMVRLDAQKQILKLKGKIHWEGNLDEMRGA